MKELYIGTIIQPTKEMNFHFSFLDHLVLYFNHILFMTILLIFLVE